MYNRVHQCNISKSVTIVFHALETALFIVFIWYCLNYLESKVPACESQVLLLKWT